MRQGRFADGRVPLTPSNIFGVLSLVFWTLTVVVSIKYVVLILRADNNGEGGLVAMLALASQAVKDRPALRQRLLFIGIFGTAVFFGDGVITPAISVLSAIEGLEVAAPQLHSYIVPITLLVLTALFMVQRHGTGHVGRWLFRADHRALFVVLAILGFSHIGDNPTVLWALSPHYAIVFMSRTPDHVALWRGRACVTGAESALRSTWATRSGRSVASGSGLAMPALVINYFGQGAMLLEHPEQVRNPRSTRWRRPWAPLPLIGLRPARR
jgi:KUP system potassium uptake protein